MSEGCCSSPSPDLPDPRDKLRPKLLETGEDLSVEDLMAALSLTKEQANYIEQSTRSQSSLSIWEDARSMRLTASNLGLICCRQPEFQSLPL